MARKTIPLDLTESQRSELFVLARKPTTPQRLVRRCQIILHRANGLSQQESGERVGKCLSVGVMEVDAYSADIDVFGE